MNDDELEVILTELKDNPDDFNDWECDFIDSISSQFFNGRILTTKQVSIIEKLHSRIPKDSSDDFHEAF